jgi:hypothetical protein
VRGTIQRWLAVASRFVDRAGEFALGIREKRRPGRPGLERNPLAVRRWQPPLVGESPGVLVQQLLGIDAITLKRPATEMMDEQILCYGQPKPGPPRPLSQVVVIKEPDSKPLIEPADRLVDDPFHQQTKP